MQHVSLIRFSDLAKCYIRIALYDGKFLTDLFKRSMYVILLQEIHDFAVISDITVTMPVCKIDIANV